MAIIRSKSRAGRSMAAVALFMLYVFLPVSVRATSLFPFEVMTPNGGETFAVGDTLTVTVGSKLSSSLCVLSVHIGPYTFGFPGQTTQFRPQAKPVHSFVIPAFFIESADTGTGPFLDSTSLVSGECAIELADYSLPDDNDFSDSLFSIIAAPIVITAWPAGSHSAGETVAVGWRAADRIPGCTIELSTDNGQTWSALSTGAITRQSASWGNFTFTIPGGAGASVPCQVQVRSSDGSYRANSLGTSAVIKKRNRTDNSNGLALTVANRSRMVTVHTGTMFKLEIYDSAGRLVFLCRGPGSRTISVPKTGFIPGLHFLRCTSGAQIIARYAIL